MTESSLLLDVPNPFGNRDALVRLLEPSEADRDALAAQLLSGTYDKPFIVEDGITRALHFCWTYTQSRMRIDDPTTLQLSYTRAMMSFLLFNANPRALLLLGLGGGSLAKYCHRHLPAARIVAVESNAHVLALRNEFAVPRDDDRFQVVEGDAGDFILASRDQYDVVLMDAFDRSGPAAGLGSREFTERLRCQLRPEGVLATNIAGTRVERRGRIERMQQFWGGSMLVLPVKQDDNDVIFAFRDPNFEPRWRQIQIRAEALRRRYGIELPAFARKLKRNRSQRTSHLSR